MIFASLLFREEVNSNKEIKYLNVALRREMEVCTVAGKVGWLKAYKRKRGKDGALTERQVKGNRKRTSELGQTSKTGL